MKEAYCSVYDFPSKNNISMRQAAYTLAVGRVVEAMQLRGWIRKTGNRSEQNNLLRQIRNTKF